MRLVVDANILVAELLRRRGSELIANLVLDLTMTDQAWNEARHELPRRMEARERQGTLPIGKGEAILASAIELAELRVARVPEAVYAHLEATARARIPRDPDDWPTVALALALDAGIWTGDNDFLGCGLPTWTTDTLLAFLRESEGSS